MAAAAAQPPVVITDESLFAGLAPNSRIAEILGASEASESRGACSSADSSSSASELPGPGKSAIEWFESNLLGLQTVRASRQCDSVCTGHYQGPQLVGGCGEYGLCGDYCVSDPTQFDYADGCVDCLVDDPGNSCDGCQDDQSCNNPAPPPPPTDEDASGSAKER